MHIPRDVWDTVVLAIVCQADNPDRMMDLARLSWVCREAYHAARPHLFRTLTIAFHDKDTLPIYSVADASRYPEQLCAHVAAQVEQVFQSTVFPRFPLPELKSSVKPPVQQSRGVAHRIRRELGDFWYIAPFVVIDGKLHLASLLENEAATEEDGEQVAMEACRQSVESLWGRPVDVRVQDGLVFVPYPMELVHRIVICDLDSGLYLFDREYSKFIDAMPALLTLPVHQVHSLAMYTIGNNVVMSNVFSALTARYSQVTECDYTILGLGQVPPTVFPQSRLLRHFKLYRGATLRDDFFISPILSHAPNLCHLSLLGEGPFTVDWTQEPYGPFHSAHLTHLTLDYAFSGGVVVADATLNLSPFRMPNLQSLLMSFEIAHILFAPRFHDDLYPDPALARTTITFPALTDLTLVDIRLTRDQVHYEHLSGTRFDGTAPLPTLPLLHMPRLTRLSVPREHRTCAFLQRVTYAQLEQMAVEAARLQELWLPSVVEINGCPDRSLFGQEHDHRPEWPSVRMVEVNRRIAGHMNDCVQFPNAKLAVVD